MNCLLVVPVNLIYTQNFPVRPETFGTTLVYAFNVRLSSERMHNMYRFQTELFAR